MNNPGSFPARRMRRNRASNWCRDLLQEQTLTTNDLIYPLFVMEGINTREAIASMPDNHRLSIDALITEAKQAAALGIQAIALFPVIAADKKTLLAEESYHPDNLICRAIRALKDALPELGIIGDVALDPYTSHGHDGIIINDQIANDETVEVLCKQALSLADAGCDIIAPSDMMDGRVGAIRAQLEANAHPHVKILSYTAKYASCFYGPFRDAVGSATNLGKADKRSYQMNPANSDEALHEAWLDVAEGADILMVKPGLPYLDIIAKLKTATHMPIFAYQVSGEYAMIQAAAERGWIDADAAHLESLMALKRAGASAILTYAAPRVAKLLRK